MKLIIFDFDGTLADSRKLIIEAHRQVFTQFGLPVPALRASLALIGRSLELVLAEPAGPDAPIAVMAAAYQPVVEQLRDRPSAGATGSARCKAPSKPHPGMILQALDEAGTAAAVR
jgi:phosphoglycolate phosphatase-like HAD superfamily hydrolase